VQAAFNYAAAAIRRDYPNRVPLEYDQSGGPVDLRAPAWPVAATAPQAEAPHPRPAPARAPSAARAPATAAPALTPAAPAQPGVGETMSAATLETSEAGFPGVDAPASAGPRLVLRPGQTVPMAPPIATLTDAIDKVAALRARFISWLTASPVAATG
jgi:hypothetical protein